MKVATISEEVGFHSEAAFSRTFKDVTGLSPAQWRRKAQVPRRQP
jgi:AraC-like DNA-binding protein